MPKDFIIKLKKYLNSAKPVLPVIAHKGFEVDKALEMSKAIDKHNGGEIKLKDDVKGTWKDQAWVKWREKKCDCFKNKTFEVKMREILFRGKRIDNNEWIEGYVVKANAIDCSYAVIFTGNIKNRIMEYYEVISETVGQYTGLKDVNEKMIFEGDIIKCNHVLVNGVVYFSKGAFGVNIPYKFTFVPFEYFGKEDLESTQVIGNIHVLDNPAL